MSYNVFPVLTGRGWDIVKRPIWSTITQAAASGAEYRTALMQYPIYEFDLTVPYLSATDWATLVGFYNQQSGSFLPFYFTHDNDSTATTSVFGTGNGSQTQFQLTKKDGAWSEPIAGVNGTPTIYDNGTPVTPASISPSGLVTFTTAPVNTHTLTWTGSYYYLVRFKDDQIELSQFMASMFESNGFTVRTVR